jgi:SAM-dependent methyltransferase
MHPEVATFLAACKEVEWDGATVYEVGSFNVNGQARHAVPPGWAQWVGFDLLEGEGVDHVGDALELLPKMARCDVVVSCEVLEHYDRWAELIIAMCAVLLPGGWLVVTCAGKGRAAHSAGGGPLEDGEHYRNVTLEEVETVAADAGVVKVYGEEGYPGDTRYLGKKMIVDG